MALEQTRCLLIDVFLPEALTAMLSRQLLIMLKRKPLVSTFAVTVFCIDFWVSFDSSATIAM